jgi:hypothetical protein
VATAIGGLAIPFGAILGFLVPNFFVGNDDIGEEGKLNFYEYLTVQNICVTLLAFPLILIARNKPLTPPSYFSFFMFNNFIFS